ncbi:MAG TPA: GNAT family N-acetyltransferase [Gemmatimonadaceae bacterium]|nr:GNAT family N-acetyltransferase [Gemmatimonadaceae bacterium]
MSEASRGDYEISTDRNRLDIASIHRFLSQSYWSPGISLETVERSIDNSLPFGMYRGAEQVGFARVITDRASFAYLADVYILETHRGQGLSRWLMDFVLSYPDLRGLRWWMLRTRDAHGLYQKLGFTPPANPSSIMERRGIGWEAPPKPVNP